MPDDPTPEPGTPTPEPGTPSTLPDDHPLVRAYRATKAELAVAKGKLQEADDAGKTELQRLTDQVTQLARERDAASAERDRYQVALDKKLTPTQAKRLVGSSLEEFTADADALLADLGITPGEEPEGTPEPTPAPGNRQEQLRGGIDPTAPGPSSDEIRKAVDAAVGSRP